MTIFVVLEDSNGDRMTQEWPMTRYKRYIQQAIETDHLVTVAGGGVVRAFRRESPDLGKIYCPECLAELDEIPCERCDGFLLCPECGWIEENSARLEGSE